tara:strand:- start:1372 stop:1569 length:198 start_codon:yes stop_codon:yes gene_type:complete
MEIYIYIGIGIIVAVVIFFLVRKNSVTKDHEMIHNKEVKNTQFNPEKVSGLMPNDKKNEQNKDKQ